MLVRTAHRGRHAGEQFPGCSRYPRCKEIVPLSEAQLLSHSLEVTEKQEKTVSPRPKPVLGELPHHTARPIPTQSAPMAEEGMVPSESEAHSAKLFCYMATAAYVLSGGLIAYGWAVRSMSFALAGASVFLLALVVFLAHIFRSSRVYGATKQVDTPEDHGPAETIEKILGGLIVLAGLGAFGYAAWTSMIPPETCSPTQV